jgi:hypothetical protein
MKLQFKTELKHHQINLGGFDFNEEIHEIDSTSASVQWTMQMHVTEAGVAEYSFFANEIILQVTLVTLYDDDQTPLVRTQSTMVLPISTLNHEVDVRKSEAAVEINCTELTYNFEKQSSNYCLIEISM